jgi:hypothetical protein
LAAPLPEASAKAAGRAAAVPPPLVLGMSSAGLTRLGLAAGELRPHDVLMSWNDTQAQPNEIPWKLFAIEVLVVLLIVGAGCLVSALT